LLKTKSKEGKRDQSKKLWNSDYKIPKCKRSDNK